MRFACLHIVQNRLECARVARKVDSQALRLRGKRGLPRKLAHEHPRRVADVLGARVLVGFREARDGARVQAAFVRERRGARVRMVRGNGQVARLGDELGGPRKVAQVVGTDAAESHLELHVGDGGEQVGVAHALADAADGALHLQRARTDSGKRVGHRTAGIVVTVNAQLLVGKRTRNDADYLLHLEGKRAAVRLAKIDGVGAGLACRAHARERVVGISLVAVEEVLGVEHDGEPVGLQIRDRVGDHAQVFLERGLQCARDLGIPRFPDDGRHRSAALDEVGEPLVLVGRRALLTGGPERGDARMGKRHLPHAAEELDVFRVRRGETALDEIDAERVEPLHDAQLVVKRKRDTLALLAVAQCAVICEDVLSQTPPLPRGNAD